MATYGYGAILPATYYNGLLTTDTRSYTGKIDLQKFNVQLLNESGIPMMLNGHDFSFCLEASFNLYKRNNSACFSVILIFVIVLIAFIGKVIHPSSSSSPKSFI